MLYLDTHCTYEEAYQPEHVYVFTGPCVVTGKPYTVTIPGAALFRLRQGEHIQDALRMLSADDREFVLSGTSPEGWTQMFGEDDDD